MTTHYFEALMRFSTFKGYLNRDNLCEESMWARVINFNFLHAIVIAIWTILFIQVYIQRPLFGLFFSNIDRNQLNVTGSIVIQIIALVHIFDVITFTKSWFGVIRQLFEISFCCFFLPLQSCLCQCEMISWFLCPVQTTTEALWLVNKWSAPTSVTLEFPPTDSNNHQSSHKSILWG